MATATEQPPETEVVDTARYPMRPSDVLRSDDRGRARSRRPADLSPARKALRDHGQDVRPRPPWPAPSTWPSSRRLPAMASSRAENRGAVGRYSPCALPDFDRSRKGRSAGFLQGDAAYPDGRDVVAGRRSRVQEPAGRRRGRGCRGTRLTLPIGDVDAWPTSGIIKILVFDGPRAVRRARAKASTPRDIVVGKGDVIRLRSDGLGHRARSPGKTSWRSRSKGVKRHGRVKPRRRSGSATGPGSGATTSTPRSCSRDGRLDVLTLEYLAELTLAILAHLRAKDPDGGVRQRLPRTAANGSRRSSASRRG